NYNLTRSAIAELTPRDISLVVDLSASMNDDSELRHYRSFVSEVNGSTRPGVQLNLKDVWIALPSNKGNNGIGNGANPAAPGAAITTGGSAGNGDNVVNNGELVQNAAWPFTTGSWDEYVTYCSSASFYSGYVPNYMVQTDSNFEYRYGIKTVVNYMLEQLWSN